MSEDSIVVPESEKGYRCEVLLDSVSPSRTRLVTMRVKYPLMVHAEFCRHRCFSRSVASNRAIPTKRIIAMVEQDPVRPTFWGKNQPGMQAEEELSGVAREESERSWDGARHAAISWARHMMEIGVHKQIANRVLSPYQWVTEIITGTDWANFFALRCHSMTQPEMRTIAEMIQKEYASHLPVCRNEEEWHIPLLLPEEEHLSHTVKLMISAARCARTSYRTHEGKVSTVEEDIALYRKLVENTPKHVSPAEHQAMALKTREKWGPIRGWKSHRYFLDNHTVGDERWSG